MTRIDWIEYGWKWCLRLGGAVAFGLEQQGDGRVYVLVISAAAMGLPTVLGLGRR